jgi:serine/threonine-protein kinase RsbW
VLHGNKKDPEKQVRATFNLTPETLTIQVSDEGEGFDPSVVPDPLSPEGLLKPSGRGIFLMRAIMDEVNFRQLSPGAEITLVKHRNRD